MAQLFNVGSKGEEISANNGYNSSDRIPGINMFEREGLYPAFLKSDTTGYIMPAFNYAMDRVDSEWGVSVTGYREVADQFPAPFTGWYVTLGTLRKFTGSDGKEKTFANSGCYHYFGNSLSTFLSPTLFGKDDPIVDLRKWIFTEMKNGNREYAHLVERRNWPEKDILPQYQVTTLVNAVCTKGGKGPDANTLQPRVLIVPSRTWEQLKITLNEMTPGGIEPLDPVNRLYKWGDITNPEKAVKFSVRPLTTAQGKELYFGDVTVRNGVPSLHCETGVITREQLAARVDLSGGRGEFHIPTYDEIVMLLLAEGQVPREVFTKSGVSAKCEHFPSAREVDDYRGGARPVEHQPAPAQSAPAPVTPAPAPVQPQPAYTAPAPAPAPTQYNSLIQDDPEDEIPGLGTSPATTPAPAPAAPAAQPAAAMPWASANLTPEEQAELENLYKNIKTAGAEGIQRMGALMAKAQAK